MFVFPRRVTPQKIVTFTKSLRSISFNDHNNHKYQIPKAFVPYTVENLANEMI